MLNGGTPIRDWSRLALPALGVAILAMAAPAQAAFPGTPGPIAYSKVDVSESGSTGGIFIHGRHKRDGSRLLLSDPRASSPAYSPDGQLIVFSSNRDPGEPKGAHIYVMKSVGGEVRQLTDGEFYDENPSFSPDGRRVIFDRNGSQARESQIYSVSVDGTELQQVSDGGSNDYDPVFTPDGGRIVFVSNRQSSGRTDRSNIFSMRPDGSQVRLLIGGPRNEFDPDVSPNGRKVAFASNRAPGLNLFVATIKGKRVRALTRTPGGCFHRACYSHPSWSPDGKHIAFLSTGGRSSSVEVMRSDGRGFATEFDSGGTEEEGYGSHVGAPAWGPRPR